MADIYEARWENAVNIAKKVNKFLDEGYLIFDADGVPISSKFTITDNKISVIKESEEGNTFELIYFDKGKDVDGGMYTKIKDYDKIFEGWKIVHPKNIETLV